MRLLYNTLLCLLLPFAVVRYLIKSLAEPLYRQQLSHRFGYLPRCRRSLWIHTVSHGETQAAKPIILALAERYPDTTIILSTTTATGRALGQQIATQATSGNVLSVYFPFDLPWLMRRAISRVNPHLVLIVETELWPNYLRELHRQAVLTMLINGRLSARSAERYAQFPGVMQETLAAFTLIGARDEQDQQRFIRIGAPAERVHVLGNIKFDQACPPEQIALGDRWRATHFPRRLVWIAASTHEGEEALMLNVHQRLRSAFPGSLLLLVPRHPNRFDAVATLIASTGFASIRRSAFPASGTLDVEVAVVLGDSMGELMAYYQAADIAVVGGSFVNVGGHNVVEPMALARPTITGPQDYNSPELIAQAVAADGLIQLSTEDSPEAAAEQIATTITTLWQEADRRERLIKNGQAFIATHQGAKSRVLAHIETLLRDDDADSARSS